MKKKIIKFCIIMFFIVLCHQQEVYANPATISLVSLKFDTNIREYSYDLPNKSSQIIIVSNRFNSIRDDIVKAYHAIMNIIVMIIVGIGLTILMSPIIIVYILLIITIIYIIVGFIRKK